VAPGRRRRQDQRAGRPAHQFAGAARAIGARANLAKSLIAKLDQPTQELGNVHVVYLKNAEATKLAQTLRSVVSGDLAARQRQQHARRQNQSGRIANSSSGSSSSFVGGPQQSAAEQLQQQQQGGGGAAGFIQADASTNTLIITAPESVYRNLRAVIDQLDVRRAQVYIESLIVEVTSDKASEFGVQWVGATGNSNSTYRVGGLQSFTTGGTNNSLVFYANRRHHPEQRPVDRRLQADRRRAGTGRAGALAGIGRQRQHPVDAEHDHAGQRTGHHRVGQNVPILTGQYTTTSGTNSNPFQTIDRKDVGLTLKVRPQISEGGTIKMAIYHETSSVDKSTLTAASGIT
jgi:general secretion pathway protein D